mgnify:CR=1 FL=1|tara:strand:+ start:1975 stop:2604 length:630 start_codon:yes stop_codon:yes gene_type:complete
MADRSVATTDTVETFRTTFNSLATDVGDISALSVSDGSSMATDLVEAVNIASNSSSTFVIGDDSSTEATITTGQTLRIKSGSGISATVSPTDDSISIALSLGSIDAAGSDTDKFLVSDGGTIKFRTGAQVASDIGAVSAVTFNNRKYTGDGSTTGFTVTSGQSTASVIVTENGVVQQPTDDYAVSSTTLTFTTAPASGVVINIREVSTS